MRRTIGTILIVLFLTAEGQSQSAPVPQQGGEAGADVAKTSQSGSLHQRDWNLFSALIGVEVRGADGGLIGELQDIEIAPDGSVTGLVVQHGGVLGIGGAEYRVETKRLPPHQDSSLLLDVAADDLERISASSDASRAGTVLIGELIGEETETDELTVRDVRFTESSVDRLVLSRGWGWMWNRYEEAPLRRLALPSGAKGDKPGT